MGVRPTRYHLQTHLVMRTLFNPAPHRKVMTTSDKMEVVELIGDKPVFLWERDKAKMEFLVHNEEEYLDIHYVTTDDPGEMKKMIDALIGELPFNAVRFIAPMDDTDKETANKVGEILEEKGLGRKKPEPKKNDRNIRDVLHGYIETEDEYYDGNEYTMLVTIWNPK